MGNIKENILRMKDMSEMLVDLAYSAVFLHDAKISKEVQDVYAKLELLEEDIYKALFKIRDSSDEERLYIMEITDHIKGIANNANEIAKLATTKIQPSIIKDIFSDSEKRVIVEKVIKTSNFVKKTIGELKIRTFTRGTIIGLRRRDNWIFNIDKDTIIEEGDEIVVVGSSHAQKLLKDAINNKLPEMP
jgi:uncharacterized protein with PhoU and TrkA domain